MVCISFSFCLPLFAGYDFLITTNIPAANAQNNTAEAVPASVPGKPVVSMPATNLNIGMDLWNASSTAAGAAKMRPNPSGAPSAVVPPGVMPEQWIQVRTVQVTCYCLLASAP